ncbi:MAG TPA: hypothetical protein VK708_10225, partial [Bryobacteraceae bacterium]|nr:hypothetical protein [Bryobacteraceae bacterium]
MNYSKCSAHAVSLLVALPLMLTSLQAQESVVPLRNWDSARYWHPNELEREAAVKPVPQGQPPVKAGVNLSFVAMTPCRLVDTRGGTAGFDGISPFSGPSIAASATVTFPVKSANSNTTPAPCGVIPSIAAAYSLNITVIPHAGAAVAFVTVWPASISQPVVSTLNDTQGKVVANAAIIPAGTPNGGISLFNYGPAIIDVVIDMNGYFATPTDLNGNTALGAATLANNTTGIDNTANGDAALNGNIGGHDNTASGYQALLDNTSGIFNTATGSNALAENVGGQGNTVSGADSMQHNTSGSLNTAIGYQALPANIAGSNNLALGSYALQNNLASNNTATGSEALQDNTTGSGNAAHGYQALMMNLTGMNNTAGGYQALQNNLASNNTATGYQALQDNTTGTG